MPEEQKDTAPTTTKEDATEVSSDGLVGGGEIAAASDQLAAVTLLPIMITTSDFSCKVWTHNPINELSTFYHEDS